MNLLGVRLNVLIGKAPLAAPAPLAVLEGLREVEVSHAERERSGFRLVMATGRSGPIDFLDDPLVSNPMLDVNARVILTVIFDIAPTVIMDGIVTRRDYVPGDEPGTGQLILTGKDISVALEREDKQVEHPGQDETAIAAKIAASYPEYGVVPAVTPPPVIDVPIPVDRTPQQTCSDWAYLNHMARRHGYVTYVESGPAPFVNTLYWGPPQSMGVPQKAISVNLGPVTNAYDVNASHDGEAPSTVEAYVKDRVTGETIPVVALLPTRPPQGLVPQNLAQMGHLRRERLETSGLNMAQALGRAMGRVNAAADQGVNVTGTLDSLRYNGVLKARKPVNLRGVGHTFDGLYTVRRVTHRISQGGYTQDFTLGRAETGALAPVVQPV